MAETKTEAQKAADKAHNEEKKVVDARAAAAESEKSPEDKKIQAAETKADDARAEAERLRGSERDSMAATTVAEAKHVVAAVDPDKALGDHDAQKFGNTPANPQLAPGLDPDAENKVRLVMTTSDFPDPDRPAVCFVNKEMVGDYLRAGWSQG